MPGMLRFDVRNSLEGVSSRVARWHIFKPKITVLVNFGGSYLQCKLLVHFMAIWSTLPPFALFYFHLVYFMAIWNIFPVLVCFTKINLATLVSATNTPYRLSVCLGR
jgi:hypothetical protein